MQRDFEFEPFSRWSFFTATNRRLIELATEVGNGLVIELGSGSGDGTLLLAEAVLPASLIIAIDPNQVDLERGQRRLDRTQFGDRVRWVIGRGEDLSDLVRKPASSVYFFNGVHLVYDKHRLFEEVWRVLAMDGMFSFNSSFFEGAEPDEAHEFYRRWMRRAFEIVRRQGLRPDRARAVARQRLSILDYRKQLESAHFEVEVADVFDVTMPIQSFEDLSRYRLWIEGVLPGIDLEIASVALVRGLKDVVGEMGLKNTTRRWVNVIARKRAKR